MTSSELHSASSTLPGQASSLIPHEQGFPKNPPLRISHTKRSSPCWECSSPCRAVTAPCSLPGRAGSSIPKDTLARSQTGQMPHPTPSSLPWHCPSPAAVPAPHQSTGTGVTHGRLVPSADIQHLPLSSFFQAPMEHFLWRYLA